VIAIDGLKVSGVNLDARIASYPAGAMVKVHLFRRDELMEFDVTLNPAPEDTCYLKIADSQDPTAEERRESWLGKRESAMKSN
jgi:predicted metalloprotease with PDZ domain